MVTCAQPALRDGEQPVIVGEGEQGNCEYLNMHIGAYENTHQKI